MMQPCRPSSGSNAALFAAVTAALAHGLARPPALRTDAEVELAQTYTERIARDLTADEARVIESIAMARERALALCRAGQIDESGSMIARARDMLTRANIGRQAFVLSDSFLCAGEGFVHFKLNRFDTATSSMLMAINRCRELRDGYGYPVEGRRIHLACNAVRIQVEAAKHEESSTIITQLLNLIDSADRRFWPYPDLECISRPDQLNDDVRAELMDQALAVVRRLDPKALCKVATSFPDSPEDATQPLAARARCFLEAIHAHSCGDFKTFLARCVEFFPAGTDHLPRSFRHLVDRLANVRAYTT